MTDQEIWEKRRKASNIFNSANISSVDSKKVVIGYVGCQIQALMKEKERLKNNYQRSLKEINEHISNLTENIDLEEIIEENNK